MGQFIIRNVRSNRTVTLYGRTLAPASVGGRTNAMVVSLEQLLDPACVEHIKLGRLAVHGEMPVELVALLSESGPTETQAPAEEPAPLAPEAPPVEPPAPEEPSVVAAEPEVAELQHTFESLKALTVTELRKIAKGHKIKSSGTEDELIQRILDHQAGVS